MTTITRPNITAPGPSGLKAIHAAIGMRDAPDRTHAKLRDRHGPTWRIETPLPGLPAITATSSITGIRTILTDRETFGKASPVYEEMGRVLGDGLLTSEGERWVAQRRTIQPLFTRTRVDGYAADFDRAAAETVASWPTDGTIDLDATMRELTVRAASTTLFGLDAYDLVAPVLGDVVTLSEMVIGRGMRPLPRLPLLHRRADRRFDGLRQRIEDSITDLVDRRNEEVDGDDDLVGVLQGATDPETGEPMSAQDVLEQAVVFLLAGHETTSTALTFALWEVSRRPRLQAALREEARAVLPTDVGVDAATILQLDLTRRVLDEAMRLHPPVPVTGRSVAHDAEVDGFLVRAGEVVITDFAGLHLDATIYDDPTRFDPRRFLPAIAKGRDAYAYLPFGGGPRACIGSRFALLEATVALARILRDRTLTGGADVVARSFGITMTPSEPVRVAIAS